MARTTAELVGKVIDVDEDDDITGFIDTASFLTTKVCGASGYDDSGPGSQMELIERWLTAHLYMVKTGQLAAAKAGTVSVQYGTKLAEGLRVTHHGQQVLMLDTGGNFAALQNSIPVKKKAVVDIAWLGSDLE